MDTVAPIEASPRPELARLTGADLAASLRQGWRDFRAAPLFGLFFAGVYVVIGVAMLMLSAGHVLWVLATSLGFPLYAPFAAVGLYEVSRRLEAGEPLSWRAVLGVVWDERRRQVPWLGAIIVIYFLFWTFLAHMIFALMLGTTSFSTSAETWAEFLTPQILTVLGVEVAVGAVLAFVLYALTVTSLPHVMDKEVDVMTAMLTSFALVRQNLAVMLVWAVLIAGITITAMIPAFLGLFIALPVLGHATWALYRRALIYP